MPMAMGAAGVDALSLRGAAAQGGQVGLRGRFVQEGLAGALLFVVATQDSFAQIQR